MATVIFYGPDDKRASKLLAVLFGHGPEKGISDGVRRAILTGGDLFVLPTATGLVGELR